VKDLKISRKGVEVMLIGEPGVHKLYLRMASTETYVGALDESVAMLRFLEEATRRVRKSLKLRGTLK
jgi:hypothetical protein